VREAAVVTGAARPVRLAALVLAGLAMAGCAAPDYRYANDAPGAAPAGTVYFKVPESWSGFTAAQISAAQKGWANDTTAKPLLDATVWQEAYDASGSPSLSHVLGSVPPESPVVYASLRSLYQAETDSVTVASLKDVLMPVSSLGDQVSVRSSAPVEQGAAKGLHLVLSFKASDNAPEETVDETAYLSQGNDALYLLVVRCTSACYDRDRADIDTVTSSYTIKEGSRG
jgi:hypothetical protein